MSNLTYNEETMFKVRRAIKTRMRFSDEAAEAVISAIQNEGIVFRERDPEDQLQPKKFRMKVALEAFYWGGGEEQANRIVYSINNRGGGATYYRPMSINRRSRNENEGESICLYHKGGMPLWFDPGNWLVIEGRDQYRISSPGKFGDEFEEIANV